MGASELADVLRGVRATWQDATAGGEACGLPVAVEAYERMHRAWLAELGAHIAVLEQLADHDDR